MRLLPRKEPLSEQLYIMSDTRDDKPRSAARSESVSLLRVFENHRTALKRFIARYLNNHHDIEDVAQESFLRAYRAGFDTDVRDPKSYLFRIAKNVAVSQLRLKSRQITDYIEDQSTSSVLTEEFTLEDEVMAQQRLGVHCEAVASLPVQCRRVYIMRKVYGMSHREIAERMGIAVKTVEKHLYKGVERCDLYVTERMEGQDRAPIAGTVGKAAVTAGHVSQLNPGGSRNG